ncbi:MAG: hypothetical protein AB1778_08655 [Candidatus Bipolaricaulota bacterium]
MPLDPVRLEQRILRAHRRHLGFRTASGALAISAGLLLALALAERFLGLAVPRQLVLCLAVLVAASGALGFLLGRRRRVDIPRLLLSVDLALGTGERLCSWHELRCRGGASELRCRVEDEIGKIEWPWRRVVRLRARDVLIAGASALALALALTVGTVGERTTEAPSARSVPAEETGYEEARVEISKERAASFTPRELSTGVARASSSEGELAAPYEDALAEILPTPPSATVFGEPSETDAGARSAGDAGTGESLSDLLSRIARRGQENSGRGLQLTDEDKAALREMAESVPDPRLRQLLLAMIDEQDAAKLEDQLEASRRLLGGAGVAAAEDLEEPPLESGRGDEEEASGSEAERALAEGSLEGTSSDGVPEAPGQVALSDAQIDSDDLGSVAFPPEEQGGTASRRPDNDPPSRSSGAGFVLGELLTELGASGDLRRFFTKGIPFEPPADAADVVGGPGFDGEALRTLLVARDLPTSRHDVVRVYFETITQGEP